MANDAQTLIEDKKSCSDFILTDLASILNNRGQ